MSDEHFERDRVTEGEFKRSLENRAEVRAEARICLDRFDGSATNLEWQETGGMDNLFGKVNLEVANHFPASFAPTLHGRESGVFKQLAAFVECVVERSVPPFVKDRFSHHEFFSPDHVETAVDTEYLAGD